MTMKFVPDPSFVVALLRDSDPHHDDALAWSLQFDLAITPTVASDVIQRGGSSPSHRVAQLVHWLLEKREQVAHWDESGALALSDGTEFSGVPPATARLFHVARTYGARLVTIDPNVASMAPDLALRVGRVKYPLRWPKALDLHRCTNQGVGT